MGDGREIGDGEEAPSCLWRGLHWPPGAERRAQGGQGVQFVAGLLLQPLMTFAKIFPVQRCLWQNSEPVK